MIPLFHMGACYPSCYIQPPLLVVVLLLIPVMVLLIDVFDKNSERERQHACCGSFLRCWTGVLSSPVLLRSQHDTSPRNRDHKNTLGALDWFFPSSAPCFGRLRGLLTAPKACSLFDMLFANDT